MPPASGKEHSCAHGRSPSSASRAVALTAVAALALGLGGCARSKQKLTSGEADRALAALDSLEAAAAAGHCGTAQSRVNALVSQAQAVNRSRPDLGAAYADSVDQLQQLVTRECHQAVSRPSSPVTGATGSSAPTPQPTPPTAPAPTPTAPTGGGVQPTAPGPSAPAPAPGQDQSGGVQPK